MQILHRTCNRFNLLNFRDFLRWLSVHHYCQYACRLLAALHQLVGFLLLELIRRRLHLIDLLQFMP